MEKKSQVPEEKNKKKQNICWLIKSLFLYTFIAYAKKKKKKKKKEKLQSVNRISGPQYLVLKEDFLFLFFFQYF